MQVQSQEIVEKKGQVFDRRPRRSAAWLYVVGVLVVLIVLLVYNRLLKSQRAGVATEAKARMAMVKAGPVVQVIRAGGVTGARTVSLIGEARPFVSATLYAKVSGYLKEIRVDKGDHVEAGQVVAIIESPETDHQYQAALADARNKRLNADRAATLVKRNMISQQDADTAEADAKVAEANVAALATLKSYEIIRAPFSGTVTARFADPGALVQNAANAQTSALPVVTVSKTDELRVYVYPDQRDAVFVKDGDPATITLPERPGVKLAARVTRVSGELDPKTRTMLTEIDFDNRRGLIVPGSFVQVTLYLHAPGYVEIPSSALVIRDEKPFVAVVDDHNRVSFRPVTIADDDGQNVRIVSGLKRGERVALSLGEHVAEGEQIQPVGE
jgi:membrane fusion protein (multidrug efflux system)